MNLPHSTFYILHSTFLRPRRGFVMLLAVLVLGTVVIGATVAALRASVDAVRTAATAEQSLKAQALAYSCAEEALLRLRETVYYGGNETLSVPGGTCQTLPVQGTGNVNRVIQVIGVSGSVTRRVSITVSQVHPTVSVSRWDDVSGF